MAYGINILFFLLVWFIHPIFLAHADINVPNKLQNDPKTCEENSDIQRNQPLLERGRFEIQKAIENDSSTDFYVPCFIYLFPGAAGFNSEPVSRTSDVGVVGAS